MSQIVELDENEEVQYVFNDTEYVLDPSDFKNDELSDIIYSDGTRAILVNGHILQGGTPAIVLQNGENLNQFYINDDSDQIFVTEDQNMSSSNSMDGTEIIQYVEDDTSEDGQRVVYVNNENGFLTQDGLGENYQIQTFEDGDDAVQNSLKKIKLDMQVMDWDDLIRQQTENVSSIIDEGADENRYQYAVLKDGKLHIQTFNSSEMVPFLAQEPTQFEGDEQNSSSSNDIQILDVSKITGKNLLTGQKVTLDSYMDNLQRKIRNSDSSKLNSKTEKNSPIKKKSSPLNHLNNVSNNNEIMDLLNMKITLGKTSNGKRLVGKIIQVKKGQDGSNLTDEIQQQDISISSETTPDEQTEAETCAMNADASVTIETPISHVGIKKNSIKQVNKKSLENVSRTLSGLMSMETVKKKLQSKNITVKVIEKKFNQNLKMYTKYIAYSFGYMKEDYFVDEDGTTMENWTYVPTNNADKEDEANKPFTENTDITLIITNEVNGERTTRVNMCTTNSLYCSMCSKEFRTKVQLRMHMNTAHKSDGTQIVCEVCNLSVSDFEDVQTLQQHRQMHIDDGKLFQCDECEKSYNTIGGLKRHWTVHSSNLKPLQCSKCSYRCASECSLKKHAMVHMKIRPFPCGSCNKTFISASDLNAHRKIHDSCRYFICSICGRSFSRQSNLQRHVDIHGGAGALYGCDICGCSYHYMSSLTRHVVQNHINVTPRKNDLETEPPAESTST